jgi:hypothetical protein
MFKITFDQQGLRLHAKSEGLKKYFDEVAETIEFKDGSGQTRRVYDVSTIRCWSHSNQKNIEEAGLPYASTWRVREALQVQNIGRSMAILNKGCRYQTPNLSVLLETDLDTGVVREYNQIFTKSELAAYTKTVKQFLTFLRLSMESYNQEKEDNITKGVLSLVS